MRLKILFIIITLAFGLTSNAQSIGDYCHSIANSYVQGAKSKAKSTIAEALSKYPNNPTIKNLANKVNKLPDDENNSKSPQQKNQQDKNQQQQQPQMSKQNAEQILKALMQDEKNTMDKKKLPVKAKQSAEKDW